uniref:Uncharacterized protein n=1 Tax=Anguilla anguilla TaxID=7936 RepID=A0A0E9QCX5_ANGAN
MYMYFKKEKGKKKKKKLNTTFPFCLFSACVCVSDLKDRSTRYNTEGQ